MANVYWIVAEGTDGNYSTGANWSGGSAPSAGDYVRIPRGTGNITAGLDQSAVAIGDFIVEDGYTGTIGSSSGYLIIDPDRFEFSGQGEAWINIGTAAISPQIWKTAQAAEGYRGLYFKGSAIATLNVVSGQVGVAVVHGETSTITTCRVVEAGASVWLGAGVTLTTFEQLDGENILRCAATTVRCHGGQLTTREIGAITTVTVNGGEFVPNSTGTITTLNLNGGSVDCGQSGAARTITTLKRNPGSSFRYDPNVITITTKSAPDYPVTEIVAAL